MNETSLYDIADEAAMVRWGHELAERLAPRSVVALVGTLGAGKTRLVQAIAEQLGVTEEVTSPTFVLVNEYTSGRLPIYHFDAYRLRDDDEFLELGPEEYFEGAIASGPGLTFVEWGDRVRTCLPDRTIWLTLEILSGESRQVKILNLCAE